MNFIKYSISVFIILSLCFPHLIFAEQRTAKEKAAYYLKKATRYYNKKQYQKSESAFQQALRTKVTLHENFYFYYGRVQALNGNYEKAEGNLSMYLNSAGKQGQYYQKANTMYESVRKKLAQQAFEKAQSSPSKKSSKPQNLTNIPNMVKIIPQSFIMGANYGDDDQKPPHKVSFNKAFAVSQHEITFNQYEAFSNATNRELPDDEGWGKGNHPVINVTMYDAIAYCEWLSKQQNRTFRLPTEAEWEYIARSKPSKSKLGFKDALSLGDANCDGCRFFWEKDATKEVGNYEPNSHNLYDTFGNVWEWTCSAYTRRYNGKEKVCLKPDKMEGHTIAVRGGSWRSDKKILKPYIRYNNFPTYKSNDLGFRIVEELKN